MRRSIPLLMSLLSFCSLPAGADDPEFIAVRHPEGLVHGFLALRTLGGTTLASGDLIQNVSGGDRVTSRLVFHFRDGSLHDETAVFTQRKQFRLVSYHLVQKGPAFPRALDVSLDGSGKTTIRYTDDGEEKVENETLKATAGLANGMLPILLKNVRPGTAKSTLAFLAVTPKPRMVSLEVKPAGEESFDVAGSPRKATHYVVHVDIHGIAGLLAPLLGKEPPDSHVWILQGDAPAFVKSESPLFPDGPLWRIELTSPGWEKESTGSGSR